MSKLPKAIETARDNIISTMYDSKAKTCFKAGVELSTLVMEKAQKLADTLDRFDRNVAERHEAGEALAEWKAFTGETREG